MPATSTWGRREPSCVDTLVCRKVCLHSGFQNLGLHRQDYIVVFWGSILGTPIYWNCRITIEGLESRVPEAGAKPTYRDEPRSGDPQ